MGEAAGVEGWRRSGVSVGNCRGSDRGIEGETGTVELEGILVGELDVGCRGREGDTA